jgi:hypothetical protein
MNRPLGNLQWGKLPQFGYLMITTPSDPVFQTLGQTPRCDIGGSINAVAGLTSGDLQLNGRLIARNHPGVLTVESVLARLKTVYEQLLGPEAEKAARKKAIQGEQQVVPEQVDPVEPDRLDTNRPLTPEEDTKSRAILSDAFNQYYRLFVAQVSSPLVEVINSLQTVLPEGETDALKRMVNTPDQYCIDPYAEFMHYAEWG